MALENKKDTKTKRFTKQRQAILEALKGTVSHPDANWVYNKVTKKVPNISLGTVYRNLNILSQEKMVRELSFQAGLSRYDANVEPHHHIMCTNCYKIEDAHISGHCDANSQMKKDLNDQLGYIDISCEILFKGICKDCQKK